MMMYALLDKKAGTYGGILLAASDGHVSRIIEERFRGSGETVEKYPEDFDLYALGEYNVDSGAIVPLVKFIVNLGVIIPNGRNGDA